MKNDKDVLVSVIMPVYNSEKYLGDAIKSVLNQTFKAFELILVDDGSRDQSSAICDQFAAEDSRIVVIHKSNGGICSARNTGIENARGEYVAFMDNDDLIESELLEENYFIAKSNNADMVKFGKREILVQGETVLKVKETRFEKNTYQKKTVLEELLNLRKQSMLTFVWDSLIRKSVIDDNYLLFDTKFKYGNEDIDFCEKLVGYCDKVVVNPKCYYNHFTRVGYSTSSKFSKESIMLQLYLLEKSNKRYEEYNLLTERNRVAYITIVTRQLVFPTCQKLNDAKKTVSKKEKIEIVDSINSAKELEIYKKFGDKGLLQQSPKLWIYRKLFICKKYYILLYFDKVSRSIVYKIRKLRSSKWNR